MHQPHGNRDHPDILINQLPPAGSLDYELNVQRIVRCQNAAEYEQACLETGITKPSIFCGFDTNRILLAPLSFGSDIMHVAAINARDLLIPLWQGAFRSDPTDDKATWDWAVLTKETWKKYESTISGTTPFLPGSFDRPPHNPAEKIHSGYKAWEWLLYLYGMGPATLYGILPNIIFPTPNFLMAISTFLTSLTNLKKSTINVASIAFILFARGFILSHI
jgi:hypothetical protein